PALRTAAPRQREQRSLSMNPDPQWRRALHPLRSTYGLIFLHGRSPPPADPISHSKSSRAKDRRRYSNGNLLSAFPVGKPVDGTQRDQTTPDLLVAQENTASGAGEGRQWRQQRRRQ